MLHPQSHAFFYRAAGNMLFIHVVLLYNYIFCTYLSSASAMLPPLEYLHVPCMVLEKTCSLVSRSCSGHRCCEQRRQRCWETAPHCRLWNLPLELQLSLAQTAVDTLSGWTAGQDVWERWRRRNRKRYTKIEKWEAEKMDGHKKEQW